MKPGKLMCGLLMAGATMLLTGCGESNLNPPDAERTDTAVIVTATATSPVVLRATPTPSRASMASPTPTVAQGSSQSCGDGLLDTNEQCDPAAAPTGCAAGQSCTCCACLRDGEPLGDHVFAIDPLLSSLRSSVLACNSISLDWLPAELTLRADHFDAQCRAPLRLVDDVILGARIPIGTFCMKLFAADSQGFVDCDSGSFGGAVLSRDSNGSGPNGPPVITTGVGDFPDNAGVTILNLARAVSIQLGPLSAPSDCLAIDYDDPPIDVEVLGESPLVITTGSASSVVAEPVQGGDAVSCTGRGRRLSCSTWRHSDGSGALIIPNATLDQLDGVLDSAEILVLTGTAGESAE